MAEQPSKGMDYKSMAEGVDELRETLRIMVAGIMAEGFSEVQAREIATYILSVKPPKGDNDD